MSIVKDYLIRCDNCHTTILANDAPETAKRMGWMQRDGKDYCSYCIRAKSPRKPRKRGVA